ncbi:hypothetical protein IWW34DRAFT_796701 [Fusarium oxysporum f. sp. albedinis]|nr:hypothetical protein IWW34DRAFT_796701 [Fusarium oxysporum f. sp. albedinis]
MDLCDHALRITPPSTPDDTDYDDEQAVKLPVSRKDVNELSGRLETFARFMPDCDFNYQAFQLRSEPEHAAPTSRLSQGTGKWRKDTQAETLPAGFTVVLDGVYQALALIRKLEQMCSILGNDCRWLELPLANGFLLKIAVWTVPVSINDFKRTDFISLNPGEDEANVVLALTWRDDCLLGYRGGKRYNWEVFEDGLTDVKHFKAFVS